jgi:hypothetical protein
MYLRVDKTAARRFDTGQTGDISKKELDPQANGEFVWLRNRVQIPTSNQTHVWKLNDGVVNRLPIFNIRASPEDLVAR